MSDNLRELTNNVLSFQKPVVEKDINYEVLTRQRFLGTTVGDVTEHTTLGKDNKPYTSMIEVDGLTTNTPWEGCHVLLGDHTNKPLGVIDDELLKIEIDRYEAVLSTHIKDGRIFYSLDRSQGDSICRPDDITRWHYMKFLHFFLNIEYGIEGGFGSEGLTGFKEKLTSLFKNLLVSLDDYNEFWNARPDNQESIESPFPGIQLTFDWK